MSAFESHAFLCSVPNPEASRFAKQLACLGVDLDSRWSVWLPMQMLCGKELGRAEWGRYVARKGVHHYTQPSHVFAWNYELRRQLAWTWLARRVAVVGTRTMFHHSARDDRCVVHSLQREVPAPSYLGEPQPNRFVCHRACRRKYSNWRTTLELWKSSCLIPAKGWKSSPTKDHSLSSCPLDARGTLHLIEEQSMLGSLNTNSIVGASSLR